MNDNSKNVVPSNIDLFNVNGLTHSRKKRNSLSFFNQEPLSEIHRKFVYAVYECSFICALVWASNIFSRQLPYLAIEQT